MKFKPGDKAYYLGNNSNLRGSILEIVTENRNSPGEVVIKSPNNYFESVPQSELILYQDANSPIIDTHEQTTERPVFKVPKATYSIYAGDTFMTKDGPMAGSGFIEKKCTCGAHKVYGTENTLDFHEKWCDYIR